MNELITRHNATYEGVVSQWIGTICEAENIRQALAKKSGAPEHAANLPFSCRVVKTENDVPEMMWEVFGNIPAEIFDSRKKNQHFQLF